MKYFGPKNTLAKYLANAKFAYNATFSQKQKSRTLCIFNSLIDRNLQTTTEFLKNSVRLCIFKWWRHIKCWTCKTSHKSRWFIVLSTLDWLRTISQNCINLEIDLEINIFFNFVCYQNIKSSRCFFILFFKDKKYSWKQKYFLTIIPKFTLHENK